MNLHFFVLDFISLRNIAAYLILYINACLDLFINVVNNDTQIHKHFMKVVL